MAEEAIDALDNDRREMLDERRMRPFDQQGQSPSVPASAGEADGFGR
jgi:hypothetical protein